MFGKKKTKEPSIYWKLALVGAFVAMIIVNGLASSTTVLGGVTTAAVSDSFPNLFAPAGITFAIWGVIYLLLIGFIAFVLGAGRDKKSALQGEILQSVTKLAVLNMVLNLTWIFAWQYKILWVSVILMLGILTTLILVARALRGVRLSRKEYSLVKLPFSIYFGWITIATVANITTFLVSLGWQGESLGGVAWMVIMLVAAAAIGIITAVRNRDCAYMLVFIWAYCGILTKHFSSNGFDGQYPVVMMTLGILLAVFGSVVVQISLLKKTSNS